MYGPYVQVSIKMHLKISMSHIIFVCANLAFPKIQLAIRKDANASKDSSNDLMSVERAWLK